MTTAGKYGQRRGNVEEGNKSASKHHFQPACGMGGPAREETAKKQLSRD